MNRLRHAWIIPAALSIVLVLLVSGCKTAPEAPVDEPVVTEPVDTTPPPKAEPEKKPEVTAPEPLSDEDIAAARAAVQRANLMGANRYYPSEYRSLAGDLNAAIAMGKEKPDEARAELRNIIERANSLYDKTLMARRTEYENKYHRNDEALRKIEADKFAPVQYRRTQSLAMETVDLYEKGNYAAAQSKADETLGAQARLHYNLSENIRYVGILRRDTENYLSDAEDNEAFLYAAQELETANSSYFDGVSAFRSYNIEKSASSFTQAKRNAIIAARTSAIRKKQSETDRLMNQTQQRLEAASRLRVLGADGEVKEARPWEGKSYLESNPLIDHSTNVEPVQIENPELRDLDKPVNGDDSDIPEDVIIRDNGAQVNGDEQDADYLMIAESMWQKGVSSRNAGQFDLANDYFRQSQAYIDAYESNAVDKTYTVVYRKIATDCLWRISERPEIFSNPFLWPKIWRANRRAIQNPDLIYPGQVLVIPPK